MGELCKVRLKALGHPKEGNLASFDGVQKATFGKGQLSWVFKVSLQ